MAVKATDLKIVQIGNPILETKTNRVSRVQDPKVVNLVRAMTQYLQEDTTSVGLAAPQVGESLSICVVKKIIKTVKNGESTKTIQIIPLINPKIIYESEIEEYFWEGCLSIGVGDQRLFGPVKRPNTIKVKYLDEGGNEKVLETEGFLAHIIQHEVDHLEGVLFIKHISDPGNIWTGHDLDEYLKEHEDYPQIVEAD